MSSITFNGMPRELWHICINHLDTEDLQSIIEVNKFFRNAVFPIINLRRETRLLECFHVTAENRLNPNTLLSLIGGIERLRKIPHLRFFKAEDIGKDLILREKSMVWFSFPENGTFGNVPCHLNFYLNYYPDKLGCDAPDIHSTGGTITRHLRQFEFSPVSATGLPEYTWCPENSKKPAPGRLLSFAEKRICQGTPYWCPKDFDPYSISSRKSDSEGHEYLTFEKIISISMPVLVCEIRDSFKELSKIQKAEANKKVSCCDRFWKNVRAFFYKIFCCFCPRIKHIQPPSLDGLKFF